MTMTDTPAITLLTCPFRTIATARRHSQKNGNHFFDRDAEQFFHCTYHTDPNELGVFVYSICYDPDSDHAEHRQRHFKIGQVTPRGSVELVAEDTAWTLDDATRYVLDAAARCLLLQRDIDRVVRQVTEHGPADQGHFDNTFFVTGPSVDTAFGDSQLYEVQVSRLTTADGATVSHAISHKGIIFAYDAE